MHKKYILNHWQDPDEPATVRNLASGGTLERSNHFGELANKNSPTTFDGRGSRSDHHWTGSGLPSTSTVAGAAR